MNVGICYKIFKFTLIKFNSCANKSIIRKPGTTLESMAGSLDAMVRVQADDARIQLNFLYGDESFQERIFNFDRSKEEHIGSLFTRIKNNIEHVQLKRLKKKKKPHGEDKQNTKDALKVALFDSNNKQITEDSLNADAWKSGYTLLVGEKKYNVRVNAPSVKSLTLPKSIMAGFPVYPKVILEFAVKDDSGFEWLRSLNHDELGNNACSMTTHWQKAGTGYTYMTKSSDVGKNLKLICYPRNGIENGLEVEVVSQNTVSAGPGLCPFEERHLYTSEPISDHSFRVVTYNILADLYADSEHTRKILYPYCPPYALDADYRKQLLIKEILGYRGDILCLQEVDSKLYRHDLNAVFSSINMEGNFLEKGGQVVEGLACFSNKKKFRVAESEGFILAEQLPVNPLFAEIFRKICENEKLKERVLARTTALQVVMLESLIQPNTSILVGNTHLYYHPDSDHIRLLQGAICIKYLENKLQEFKKQWPEKNVSLIFCGDFNSCPEFGIYQLMTKGSVPHTSPDWLSAPEEAVRGLSVSQNLGLSSACGAPEYTNYTPFFSGCLDYIFFQPSSLNLESWVPLPSHEDVTQHIALPSILFPSDHIALISTFSWKNAN